MASASSDAKVPLLASASGTGSGVPHAVWRPQMQTFLMRHGIEERDYTEEIAQWQQLATAVASDARTAERADFAAFLAGSTAAASSNTSDSSQQIKREALTAEQQTLRQRVATTIGRSRRAYGFLYAALPADLRPLVADVPQGYAFGIWSFLEKKFRSTEQDSVMALWKSITSMAMEEEESFEVYKARVDSVNELLASAKQIVPAGLYASLLLWNLQPSYSTAVLTLKTGDKLKDPAAIDWSSVTEYMAQYERSQHGLGTTDSVTDRALALRNRPASENSRSRRAPGALSDVECYNCNEFGHYASDCPWPDRRQKKKNGQWQRHQNSERSGPVPSKNRGARHTAAESADSSEDDGRSDDSSVSAEGESKSRVQSVRTRQDYTY